MPSGSVLVVTQGNDLHALLIQRELQDTFHTSACVIEYDSIAKNGIHWQLEGPSFVLDREGKEVDLESASLCWWRRIGVKQKPALRGAPDAVADLIGRNSYSAVTGYACASFRGRWVSDPVSTGFASNKMVQLCTAREEGLTSPPTIVSNLPGEIRAFAQAHARVIVKPLQGMDDRTIFTREVNRSELHDDAALRLAPAIYQERVEATSHLRVNIFGDQVYGFRIDSPEMDWRMNPKASQMFEVSVDADLQVRMLNLQRRLGLEMSIHDLIVDRSGEPIWLEVNPQGQFLFLEGMTGAPLARRFCEFLVSCL